MAMAARIDPLQFLEVAEADAVQDMDNGEGLLDDDSARDNAVSRVDAIISRATDQIAGGPDGDDPLEASLVDEAESPDRRDSDRRKTRRKAVPHIMGTGAVRNAKRGAEIARILAAPRRPADVRTYLASRDFGRVPAFLSPVEAQLDAERGYIVSLREPREASTTAVRLLTTGEKADLVAGLEQRFEYIAACALKAEKKSKERSELEADMIRIEQDIESLSRPYIFVEA